MTVAGGAPLRRSATSSAALRVLEAGFGFPTTATTFTGEPYMRVVLTSIS
jgi:hypothetical protein